MKPLITAIISLLLPNKIAIPLLNILGHKIHSSARIGYSWLYCQGLYLDKNTRIGHFNLIRIRKLLLREGAFIKSFNRMKGPLNILMQRNAAIANSNSIYRGSAPVCLGLATLKLGHYGQLISKHHLDCTKSIEIGNYTTIGGLGTQFWTHGFVHAREGLDRIRVDGPIKIGNNVYVGTRCTFNPGIRIGDGITIGSNVCVSKSLQAPGMYVAQSLRFIETHLHQVEQKLKRNENYSIGRVYEKSLV